MLLSAEVRQSRAVKLNNILFDAWRGAWCLRHWTTTRSGRRVCRKAPSQCSTCLAQHMIKQNKKTPIGQPSPALRRMVRSSATIPGSSRNRLWS